MAVRKVNVVAHQRRTKTKIANVRQHNRQILRKPQKIDLTKSERQLALNKYLEIRAKTDLVEAQIEAIQDDKQKIREQKEELDDKADELIRKVGELRKKERAIESKVPMFEGAYDKVFLIDKSIIKTQKREDIELLKKREFLWNGMHKKFPYISDASLLTAGGNKYLVVDYKGKDLQSKDKKIRELNNKQINQIIDQTIYASRKLGYLLDDIDNDGNIATDSKGNAFIIDYGNANPVPKGKMSRGKLKLKAEETYRELGYIIRNNIWMSDAQKLKAFKKALTIKGGNRIGKNTIESIMGRYADD